MDKESLDKLLNSMNFEEEVKFQDIPSIDLYMDQVISIFENSLKGYKRNEKDKILTKTMINNYVKDKLLMGVKNKKYSREHIILLILIYNLKQSLAIGDIKKTLTPLIEKLEDKKESIPIKDFYDIFLNIKKEETLLVNEDLYKKLEIISSNIAKSNFEEKDRDYLTSLFMIISLINTSNMYKKLAEKFIDDNIKGMEEK
ncbi:DUF1836 domain-containing protein [Clostridium algidicarnis]|uniref:DUF1836 domain-containing protein n=1 Tax=Clostridium algidicarnis TaxID=37659 RepID=UPI001C0B0BFD|nr:DUF1836 domain-containing protein [Clostridium algidicarnis]MBU3196069.1 DUF1836 domain-containing protein [Clostridium algidicarnis]MBU3209114.1 DUF1836 domain-containing protein [Clostridium algidicarnis]MBU3228988.1 DUF1836 domain-containing protein [Clostridium algidicarnis]MBU3252532.1 DUF1836 domain-containing protein [Clostridium algidicarnis]